MPWDISGRSACRRELTAFELGDLDGSPTLGSARERTEHQLDDRFLAEGIRDDLEAAAPVRIGRRCVTGMRRCAMQASISMKQATARSCEVAGQ